MKDFLVNSKCATTIQQKKYLTYLVANQSATLLYSGSLHGWKAEDFHSRCDLKGPTISLFKIKKGDCIGGYTTNQWKSIPDRGKYDSDDDSVLFNLNWCRHFPKNKNGASILASIYRGPSFGLFELNAGVGPFNEEYMCTTWAGGDGSTYAISVVDGINMLTN